jgi:hypothetical protein
LISDYSALLVENLRLPEEPPFPVLPPRDVKAVIEHGKKHSWDTRANRGWPQHTDIFKDVHVAYARWVGRGASLDPPYD